MTQSCPLPPVPPSATELAIKNWLPALAPIQGDFPRWFLWLWSHAAALTSLLDGLGFCPPLGLYLYCEGPNALTYLRRLLCFYGDEAVSLDLPSDQFSRLLMYRKDQPLVIEDTDRTKSAGDNASVMDEMLVTRSLPWKNGRDCVQLPIRALPTIIASSVSGLACNPGLITLDMPAEQFDLDDFWSEFPGQEKQNDYLMNFLSHVKSHIPELRTALETAREEAWRLCDNNQAENCVQFLGIALALYRFLREFYADHHVDLPVDMTEEELTAQLLEVLDEVSIKKEAANCLDSQFVTVTRTMIGHGDLSIQPLAERHAAPKDTLTVYADDGSLYFTPAAFDQVCKWLGYSRPIVLRALTSANLIQGSPINQSTVMTRIRLWDVYGRRYSAHVYRLRRDVFEQMGDLFLDNEGESL